MAHSGPPRSKNDRETDEQIDSLANDFLFGGVSRLFCLARIIEIPSAKVIPYLKGLYKPPEPPESPKKSTGTAKTAADEGAAKTATDAATAKTAADDLKKTAPLPSIPTVPVEDNAPTPPLPPTAPQSAPAVTQDVVVQVLPNQSSPVSSGPSVHSRVHFAGIYSVFSSSSPARWSPDNAITDMRETANPVTPVPSPL